ncbi:hypothetical protein C922_00891 [Plasmodium inui San Antonio 1]|uniref:Uncharacterized protein n=1 Tax=Plasmodium inui San Antonio 1 TaxID=1237626 RepID=W7A9W3_9APIC|nr:hypothetical protein C922_00891 [Plasmodium inui San Antonio 1]EUD68495.1 hypothetical protein C922_00891 [Plasmodium inui San Antonio 1]
METENKGKSSNEEMDSSTENLVNQKSIENLTSIDNIKNEKINLEDNNDNYFNYTEDESLVKNEVQSIHNVCTEAHQRNIFSEHNLEDACIDSFQMNLADKDDADDVDNPDNVTNPDKDYTDAEVQMRNQQDILKILEDEDTHLGLGGNPGMGAPITGQHLSLRLDVQSGENLLGNTGDAENGKNDSMAIGGEDAKEGVHKEGDINGEPLSAGSNNHQVASTHEEDQGGGAAAVATAAVAAAAGENPFRDADEGDDQPLSPFHAPKEKAEINIILNKDLLKAKKRNDKSKDRCKDRGKERNKYRNKFFRLFRKKDCPNKVKPQDMSMNEVASLIEGVGERRRSSSTNGSSGRGYIQHNLSGSFNEYNRDPWKGGFKQGGFQEGGFQQRDFQQGSSAGKDVTSGAPIPIRTPTGEIHQEGENQGKEPFFQREDQNIVAPVPKSRTCSIKTDDNLIMDLQNEHIEAIDLEANKGNIGTIDPMATFRSRNTYPPAREQKRSCESITRKIYSLEKIKSFMSNNTFLKDKKSFLQKKKTQLSKELNFFCHHYNVLLCFFLYIICFAFVTSSICYDSWKVHEMELKSENTEKAVHIDIGATTIRRVEKVSKQNGDVTLSIDKEQTMESLIANEICKPVTKEELENFLISLASNNMLKYEQNLIDPTKGKVTDDFLLDGLRNPADVGLLKDDKLVLARKHIFGPTIYNLECKFLAKIRKAGTYHMILLYAILFFLLIPICLLFHILFNNKKEKNVLLLKYISFVLVNLALITMISSLFSVNRAYNIPLCVMNDGSSDICEDGTSIHLIRSSIILLIFSNLFFCKFVNVLRKRSSTLTESLG